MDERSEKKIVLVVDDDKNILRLIQAYLEKDEYKIYNATDGNECFDILEEVMPDVVLLDLRIPGMDGLAVMERIKKFYPELPIVMMSAHGTIEAAVDSMKIGAYDFVTKPFESNRLKLSVRNAIIIRSLSQELQRLKNELYPTRDFGSIIGRTGKMQEIYKNLDKITASASVTVLIMGESGTGKELVAREIHNRTPSRAKKTFVAVNCAALPESLLESELFGHEKGAFTGATDRRVGKFEQANGGTIFLDEIGEMTPATQAKLIRVLQEREFSRIGGNDLIKVDVRLVSATNKNLEEAVKAGTFREDLYYRLSVFPIIMPTLRDRKEDLPLLAAHFMEVFKKREKKDVLQSISREALDVLFKYDWPGNVRELQNTLERAVVVASGSEIQLDDLPQMIKSMGVDKPHRTGESYVDLTGTMEEVIERVEERVMRKAFAEYDGNVSEVARRLNIGRATIYRKAEKYRLPIKD
ncbi:MAG: sigma-54-dependent Fis family transcriptional regulator [Bacteroidetes bacterium]|nr:sigma-54-dependent Fis family transcriptional regulator [Bacteroidota bacterium]